MVLLRETVLLQRKIDTALFPTLKSSRLED
jgi:hypothetical protein